MGHDLSDVIARAGQDFPGTIYRQIVSILTTGGKVISIETSRGHNLGTTSEFQQKLVGRMTKRFNRNQGIFQAWCIKIQIYQPHDKYNQLNIKKNERASGNPIRASESGDLLVRQGELKLENFYTPVTFQAMKLLVIHFLQIFHLIRGDSN